MPWYYDDPLYNRLVRAAINPKLPAHIRAKYREAADRREVTLILKAAMAIKLQRMRVPPAESTRLLEPETMIGRPEPSKRPLKN